MFKILLEMRTMDKRLYKYLRWAGRYFHREVAAMITMWVENFTQSPEMEVFERTCLIQELYCLMISLKERQGSPN